MAEHPGQVMGDVAFTYRWYAEFLRDFRSRGYEFRRFSEPLEDGGVLLRHDVDLSLAAAVRMARREADMDVRATYCVQLTSPLYNPFEGAERRRVREIASLGHEVALHFSTHEYWRSDEPPAEPDLEARVDEERDVLATLAGRPPTTVSFHIPPAWVLDRSFAGFRSTYAPPFFSEISYVADSGQRWREDPPDPADLPGTFQLLTHPGLWDEEDDTFEARIHRWVDESCRRTSRRARREIIEGVTD